MPFADYRAKIRRFFVSNKVQGERAPFRVRSPERDSRADSIRLGKIERLVRQAIAAAEAERTGLERRLADASIRTSLLMDNDASDYGDRDQAAERRLADVEGQLVAAASRIRQINAHIEHLARVLEALKVS